MSRKSNKSHIKRGLGTSRESNSGSTRVRIEQTADKTWLNALEITPSLASNPRREGGSGSVVDVLEIKQPQQAQKQVQQPQQVGDNDESSQSNLDSDGSSHDSGLLLDKIVVPQQKMVFVGCGPVAALMIALLSRANSSLPESNKTLISVILREGSKDLEILRKSGIRLQIEGNPQEIVVNPKELKIVDNFDALEPQDHIIVCTKAYDHTRHLFEQINKLKKTETPDEEKTTVVFAQNGVPCWFAERLGHEIEQVDPQGLIYELARNNADVVGCALNFSCMRKSDTESAVFIASRFRSIEIPMGQVRGKEGKNLRFLVDTFRRTGVPVGMAAMDPAVETMRKLQVNAAINGLCAITGLSIGEFLEKEVSEHEQKGRNKIVSAVGMEVESIADSFLIKGSLRKTPFLLKRILRNHKHYPSSVSDFNEGRQLETAQIYRALVEIANQDRFVLFPVFLEKIADTLDKMVQIRDQKIADKLPLKDAVEFARKNVGLNAIEELLNMAERRLKPNVDADVPTPSPRVSNTRGRLVASEKLLTNDSQQRT